MVARWGGERGLVKRGKGLRSTIGSYNSHGDVNYSTGDSQYYCDHHMWCQVGTSQGDHSVSYINVPPLCRTPETNVILDGNCN